MAQSDDSGAAVPGDDGAEGAGAELDDDTLHALIALWRSAPHLPFMASAAENGRSFLWTEEEEGVATILFAGDGATMADAELCAIAANTIGSLAEEVLALRERTDWQPIDEDVADGDVVVGWAAGHLPIVGRLSRRAHRDACSPGAVAVVDDERRTWLACTHYVPLMAPLPIPTTASRPQRDDADAPTERRVAPATPPIPREADSEMPTIPADADRD